MEQNPSFPSPEELKSKLAEFMLHRDIIPEVLSGSSRFEYETEMLIIASRKRYRIASVPISTIYSDEVSSINPVRDTLRFFKLMRRYKNL